MYFSNLIFACFVYFSNRKYTIFLYFSNLILANFMYFSNFFVFVAKNHYGKTGRGGFFL